MYLVVAATEMEMAPLRSLLATELPVELLVTGVGPVETAMRLTRYLEVASSAVSGVILFGVAGAYPETGLSLLDLCLATREVFGDLGVCLEEGVMALTGEAATSIEFVLDGELRRRAGEILAVANITFRSGPFVTVCCVSGTSKRGEQLYRVHQGLCENMEGGAAVRVCREYALPCLELRCISNLVEDRDPGRWRLAEASQLAAEATGVLLAGLTDGLRTEGQGLRTED
jgi:futalosine hydrolase